MKRISIPLLILLLALGSALGALSVDLYLPSMPSMILSFHTTKALIQQTMSYNLVGFGIGQLFVGPLLERFGRRPLFLWMLGIYLIACLLCILAINIHFLIVVRCVQALGACGPSVAAVAIVRDLFPSRQAAKALSIIMMVVGFSPVFAPVIGGYLALWFSWKAAFILLMLLAFIVLLAAFFLLPETHKDLDVDALRFSKLWRSFATLFSHRQYRCYVIINAVEFSCLAGFVTASPFLIMEKIGLNSHEFGYAFAVNAFAFMLGAFIVSRLTLKVPLLNLVKWGLVLSSIGSLGMLVFGFLFSLSLWSLLPAMMLVTLGLAIVMPSTLALAMAPFAEIAGMASALAGFLRFSISGGVSILTSYFYSETQRPLAWLLCALVAIALIHFFWSQYNMEQGNAE